MGKYPKRDYNYDPDYITARTGYSDWEKEYEITDNHEYEELTKEQHARQKYRYTVNPLIEPYTRNEATAIAMSLYYDLAPIRIRQQLLNILAKSNYCDVDRLSDISGIYKKYQHLLTDDWIYFVDLQTLSDYKLGLDAETMVEKITNWVGKKVEHDLPDFNFNELYRIGARSFFFDHYSPASKLPITIRTFLNDPMYWATNGSSDGPRLYSLLHRKAKKSKWATALACSVERLIQMFYDTTEMENRASTKRELSKARMIISGDIRNYLRMAFMGYWLRDVLRNHENTTLFYNSAKMYQMWNEMIKNTLPIGSKIHKVNMPLDESKFDHNVNLDMLRIQFEELRSFIDTYADIYNKDELLAACDMTMKSTERGTVQVRFKTHVVKIDVRNGLLSGWYFTALFGTQSNYAKVIAFRLVVSIRSGSDQDFRMDPLTDFTSQGDDLRSRARSYLHAKCFADLYTETGFEVHPRKFFVSPFSDEFLRKVALYGKILTGYPARGVSTLLFRNPIRETPLEGEARIREMCANWLLVGRRMNINEAQIVAHMVRDVSRATAIPKATITDYVYAMSNRGGLGLVPNNNKTIIIQPAVFDRQQPISEPDLLKTLQVPQDIKHFAKNQWVAGIAWSHKPRLISPFNLRVIETSDRVLFSKKYDISTFTPFEHASLIDGPSVRRDLTPSEAHCYKEDNLRAPRGVYLAKASLWMAPESIGYLSHLLSSAGMKTVREWTKGELVGSVPESIRSGPIMLSTYYNMQSRTQLVTILSRSNIYYSSIQKARLYAEELAVHMCATSPVRVTE